MALGVRLELGKDLLLDAKVLDDRLDHEVDALEVRVVGRRLDALEDLVGARAVVRGLARLADDTFLVVGQLDAELLDALDLVVRLGRVEGDELIEDPLDAFHPTVHELLLDVLEDDLLPVEGEHLGDRSAHGARAHDSDLVDEHGERPG